MNDAAPGSLSGENKATNNNIIMNIDINKAIDNLSFLSNGYDNLISILTSENKLCERKLTIFNNKRLEEENKKMIIMRKIAKIKQLDEAQSLDPANFRNQKNF